MISTMRHLASPIAKSFSEALRIDTEAGSWIFIAGQVGVAIPPVALEANLGQTQQLRLSQSNDGELICHTRLSRQKKIRP